MNINRRKFLATTALASGSVLAHTKTVPFSLPNDFSVVILATNWGFKGNADAFCAKAKESGYDGIEVWLPDDSTEQKALMQATEKYGLKYGLLVGGSSDDFKNNSQEFKTRLKSAVATQPLFINCHSGKDYFSFEENSQLIKHTAEVQAQSGIPIYHETHRGKMLYNAPLTKQFLEAFPDLRVTLDISHWCVVHESLLHNQTEAVNLALERSSHVHSRVGQPESPQISDPRSPEWSKEMKVHFDWWDQVVKHHVENGKKQLTMTTEFGPPNYMPALPYTRQPVVDLWTINAHMKDLWRERYKL